MNLKLLLDYIKSECGAKYMSPDVINATVWAECELR